MQWVEGGGGCSLFFPWFIDPRRRKPSAFLFMSFTVDVSFRLPFLEFFLFLSRLLCCQLWRWRMHLGQAVREPESTAPPLPFYPSPLIFFFVPCRYFFFLHFTPRSYRQASLPSVSSAKTMLFLLAFFGVGFFLLHSLGWTRNGADAGSVPGERPASVFLCRYCSNKFHLLEFANNFISLLDVVCL